MIPKRPSKRVIALACATAAGFEGDCRTFTRLFIESRVNRRDLTLAWERGVSLRLKQAMMLGAEGGNE